MKKNNDLLVFFYATWCSYCKPVIPIIDTISQLLFESDANNYDQLINGSNSSNIIMVDNDIYPSIIKDNKIKSFPTIKLYKDFKGNLISDHPLEKTFVFDGQRDLDSLLKFYNNRGNTKNNQSDKLLKGGSNTNTVIALFYMTGCPHCENIKPLFNNISNDYIRDVPTEYPTISDNPTNIRFVNINGDEHPELCENYNIDSVPTIYQFNDVTNNDISNHPMSNMTPLIIEDGLLQPDINTTNSDLDLLQMGGYYNSDYVPSDNYYLNKITKYKQKINTLLNKN